MSHITFNDIGNIINQDLIIRLSDTTGVAKFKIEDGNSFPVFTVDSKGNVGIKGKTGRTTTN